MISPAKDSSFKVKQATTAVLGDNNGLCDTDAAMAWHLDPRNQVESHVFLKRSVVPFDHAQDMAFTLIWRETNTNRICGSGGLLYLRRALSDNIARNNVNI